MPAIRNKNQKDSYYQANNEIKTKKEEGKVFKNLYNTNKLNWSRLRQQVMPIFIKNIYRKKLGDAKIYPKFWRNTKIKEERLVKLVEIKINFY